MSNKKNIEKIRKIIAKAESTHSDQEAQSFMSKATELLLKYNLTKDQVEGSSTDGFICNKYVSEYTTPWHRLLATCLAEANNTHIVFRWKKGKRSGAISILGEEVACNITIHMYEVLKRKIEEFADKSFSLHKSENEEIGFGYMTFEEMVRNELVQGELPYKESYYKGFVIGLYTKFKQEEERRDQEHKDNHAKYDDDNREIQSPFALMKANSVEKLKEMAEHEFEDVDLKNDARKISFSVDEGSRAGERDGMNYKEQRVLQGGGEVQDIIVSYE